MRPKSSPAVVRDTLERVLPEFLARHTWFGGMTPSVLGASLLDVVTVDGADRPDYIVPTRVAFSDRDAERYLLVLTILPEGVAGDIPPDALVARVHPASGEEALLVDVIQAGLIGDALQWIAREARDPSRDGAIAFQQTGAGGNIDAPRLEVAQPVDLAGSNDVFLAEDLVIKFLRRLSQGVNPEWEIGAALTEQGFAHAPTVLGQIQYRHPEHGPMTIAVLQRQAPNDGHAWDATARFLDTLLDRAGEVKVAASCGIGLDAAGLAAAFGEATSRCVWRNSCCPLLALLPAAWPRATAKFVLCCFFIVCWKGPLVSRPEVL